MCKIGVLQLKRLNIYIGCNAHDCALLVSVVPAYIMCVTPEAVHLLVLITLGHHVYSVMVTFLCDLGAPILPNWDASRATLQHGIGEAYW